MQRRPLSTETPEALWPEGTDRILLDRVESTMEEAARLAPELHRPTWIMARRQTGGRGRQGRKWTTGAGNFAATYVMRPEGPPGTAALRSFLAANALFETLAFWVDRTRLAVKWPNDVLLNDGKVAGILLEASGQGGHVDWLSIGIGVNLVSSPAADPDRPIVPVSLRSEGITPPEREDFLTLLAVNYATEERIFADFGFPQIRETWLENAARLGETITARSLKETVSGKFETVDEAGRLILSTASGRHVIAAADVYF
ncbi:MAG: biotin--[acetyl-CoA-carboxylase] ligase [Paracoccaceae bacterium]|nr:biotin--[acetyl-CoA-carboxylase] ligase [Paracoccaceae bacterium]